MAAQCTAAALRGHYRTLAQARLLRLGCPVGLLAEPAKAIRSAIQPFAPGGFAVVVRVFGSKWPRTEARATKEDRRARSCRHSARTGRYFVVEVEPRGAFIRASSI